MSNMCLVVTPAIEELASKIQQEYPEACQRNGFNNQMCAEWIGLYNNTNSKNPDNVPAMKSLVNFIEKLRNQEGKSFLRDLKAEALQMAVGNPVATPSQESQYTTKQLIDHLKSMGIPVHDREEMIQYLNEHGYNSIQEAIKIDTEYVTDTVSDDEKEDIFTQLKKINRAKRTLIDTGQGLYLTDHSDAEGLYRDKETGELKGFQVKLWIDTRNYSKEEIETTKNEIENGNIRNQEDVDSWTKEHLSKQGHHNSDSIDAEDRRSNDDNARLDNEASYGETFRRQSNQNSQENFGTGWIKIPNSDGTNSPRYIPINNGEESFFLTPQGEIFGFVAPNGDIYLDETVVSPEHPIHEYTHLWDRASAKNNPKLWQRGVELMKNLALWKEIEDSDNYGKKWKALSGMTDSKLESLIASEVHARLVGENGEKLLNQIAEEKGNKGIIDKLKQWILDAWKDLKATFGNWSQEEIAKLTLKDFNHMTVRDFADGINPSSTSPSTVAFTESTGGYQQRTKENADWSDITLALATDFSTAGEKLTKKVAGEKYTAAKLYKGSLEDPEELTVDYSALNDVVEKAKKVGRPIKLNIAGNGIYTFKVSQEKINDVLYSTIKYLQDNGVEIQEVRSGGQTGVDEAGIIAAQRLGIPASVHAPKGFVFRTVDGRDIANREAFESRFNPSSISSPSQAASINTSSPSSPSQNTVRLSNRAVALEDEDDIQEVSEPKPLPQSDSFKTALKVTDSPITKFYQTFTPQQIKDRGTMIASYFSDILDDYILDELDRLEEEIKEYDDILKNSSSNRYQKREAQRNKEEATTLKNLLRDPVNGRQYASQRIEDAETGTKGIKAIIEQVKRKIKDAADRHDGVEKQLWQNTYDYFDDLFNNQASLEIEEQEGIRIVGLQTVETTPDEVAIEEENDGNDETGHTVSGNDGWLFQVRFEDPASSLSKRVRRMLYNIKRSDADRDDLGQERKYSSGQIYATLLSYLAKNMQNPDDFMYVVHSYDELPEVSSPIRIQDEEEFGDRYPNGYPVFPVLEKMSSQYPWVRQIITRLADDYLDKDWNTCIAYPSTYGAMASQFYTNFRKVFIPYAKIQTGTQRDGSDYFGITPLNTEMEARCQKDKLAANFNNGIVMTDTCIYNQDTTINREHADDLKDCILDVTNDGGVEHAYSLYSDLSDSTSETTEAVTKEFNDFTDKVVFLLNSFGISSNRDNVVALLAQEKQGKTLLDMLKDLHYVADLVSSLSDEKAKDFNYFLDLRYTGGEPVWGKFFDGRGMITDESYMQSFYDSASKKTRYSYSADNYLQKTFRGLYNPNLDERRAFIEENFMKYEWFYNHKTNTWRNKWLEHLYNAQDITDTLPYRNINNTSEFKEGETKEVRDYRMWTPDDVWLVQNRSFDSTKPYAFYLAPIFSDSPMSMTVKGPVLSNDEVLDAFVGLVDQEMWRIKYAGEREAAIERGDIKPIANFDVIDGKGGRGKKFCFIPELNDFTFENGEKFTDAITRMRDNKAEDGSTVAYSEEDIANMEKDAIKAIMNQKALEYLRENVGHYDTEHLDTDEFLRGFMNMTYANAAIIQLTTIDLAFYKSDVDFQKRFKEVYAGGIQLNTNSRYGKKTENTILLADDIITSPSYDTIAKIINSNPNLTNKDKEHILSAFTDINVADAQAIRSMHSFRSVMDMMGRWDEKAEEALEHFEKGEWGKEDFDTIFQTIKPFVYTVIDRNDGNGGVIPVPQQHKNSEICALMMYDLITNDLNSPVYKALSKFMETKDSNGEYLIDMIQFESAGKVGNQGLINISFNPDKVMKMLNSDEYDCVAEAPNTLENAETNYKAIKKQMDKKLVGEKITQEEYDKVMQSLRPTEEEIISILEQTALVKDADGNTSINPEVVHTIPFDNYYQAQPTPEHHIDAEATFGSQARNIAVADLPDDFTLTVKVKGSNHTFRGKDAVVDFYYELLDENLIEDFYGDGREGSRNKDGLKGIFSSKESLMEAVTDIVRGNPKYGKDFVDALRTDSDGNFTISPNSPTMFTLMQELITSLFKNRITKQKINGAALIQAAGIGLDEELRLLKDSKGKIIGAQCLMPLTSENFFRPLLKTDEDGRKYFDVNDLPKDLRKAVGYRIPTENKSSMLPLYIKGFTPQQNGSAIILPAEITTLAGSDFDVDKMFVMLSEFYIQNYDMEEARKAWAEEEYFPTSVFSNPSLDDELSEADPEAFREWFKENRNRFRWTSKGERPKIKRVEYNWNLTPKQNGRKARNNMLIQMIYGILTSEAGNQSLLNPQGFDNLKNAAKLNRIIKDPVLSTQLLQTYGDIDDAADAVLGFSLDQKEDFIKEYSSPDAPIYPQTFAHSHAKNMAGSNQIGIYAIQASMAAKYQRADITLKEFQRFTVNGRVIKDVDVSDNGKRLKSCGEMIGASADNGKDPNLSDAGSTSKTAPIIGYMLRLGLTHEEAVLIINQPIMEESGFSADTMERNYPGNIRMLHPGEVNTKTLVKAILDPESIDYSEQQAIDAMCYRILKQAKAMEGLTMISRADSPNGAMQNTFAKARIQQYMVERFNAEMKQRDFPFYPINEVINNTTVDVSKGEENVREALGKQPMAFLHAMYGLGINSLNDLASPYFFMLRDNFDDAIVKPILYNQSSTGRDHLEDLVNNIYMDYITYSLSASPLFGEEDNENGEHTSMKSKREYYLNTFPDDFAKILQENEEIRRLLGNILKREIIKDKYTGAVTKRIVLDDVGSLAKGQRDIISRRFDALLSSKEGQELAKRLLLYAYYDTGLNFSHNSYSTRLSTYFLSQFPAFREILQQLDTPLTEEQQQNFIYQFLITHKDAAFNVDSIKSKKMQINSGSIVVDLSDNNLHRKFTNTILSPDPRMTGVKPYPFISYDGNVYELDADAYARERNIARYYMLEDYPTSSRGPVYNINLSLSQLADEYLGTEEQHESGETSVDENTSPDIAHNSGNENPAVDNTDTQTSDTSGEFDFDNLFEAPASESENYENEGKSSLESPFC